MGDVDAMYKLGVGYEGPEGRVNVVRAAEWFRKAADGGSVPAMVELGVLCGRGDGVPQSYSEEMRWYKLAADKGDDIAMFYIGHMYWLGDGVPQDHSEALDWYRKSAERGQAWALWTLGELYRDGDGVPQDLEEAYFWLNLSAVDPLPGEREERDAVALRLTPEKRTEIQERCRKWAETHPKIHLSGEEGIGARRSVRTLPARNAIGASSQPAKSPSSMFRNERLKLIQFDTVPMTGDDIDSFAEGIWLPESSDPAKALLIPEQVQIICTHSDMTCRESTITLGAMEGIVSIMGPDEKDWPITSWDAHGLIASYGPAVTRTAPLSDRCHRHVLTMSFESKAVSTSDIPTHEKGCEMFPETDSYRLNGGQYYVDTSPASDQEKPHTQNHP